jgi:hypothetical protein
VDTEATAIFPVVLQPLEQLVVVLVEGQTVDVGLLVVRVVRLAERGKTLEIENIITAVEAAVLVQTLLAERALAA